MVSDDLVNYFVTDFKVVSSLKSELSNCPKLERKHITSTNKKNHRRNRESTTTPCHTYRAFS